MAADCCFMVTMYQSTIIIQYGATWKARPKVISQCPYLRRSCQDCAVPEGTRSYFPTLPSAEALGLALSPHSGLVLGCFLPLRKPILGRDTVSDGWLYLNFAWLGVFLGDPGLFFNFNLGLDDGFIRLAEGTQRVNAAADQLRDGEDLLRGYAGKELMVANRGQAHTCNAAALRTVGVATELAGGDSGFQVG